MRLSPRLLLPLALVVSFPIGVGCSHDGTESTTGVGGAIDVSSGDVPPFESASVAQVSVGTGGPPGFADGNWFNRYGDAADQRVAALAVDGDGNSAITGSASGTIDFGNVPWSGGATDTDAFVAKLDVHGKALWSRRYGDSCDQHGGAVALGASGNVLIAGDFCGKMDFGSTDVATTGAEVDAFVAVLDPLGEDVYSHRFGGAGPQVPRGAVMDAKGNALILGSFTQAFDDGSGPVASAGKDDIFLLELDPAGKVLWSKHFGGPEADVPHSIALDPAGNIFLGGSFGGAIDFGGDPLTATAGHTSAFLVALDPTGKHLWSQAFVGDGAGVINAVAAGPTGTVAATGSFVGSIDLGAGPIVSLGEEDAFVAVVTSAGKPVWSKVIAGMQSQIGTGVAINETGQVAIAGTSNEAVLIDGVKSLDGNTVFIPEVLYLARFDGGGTIQTSQSLSSSLPIENAAVGLDAKLGAYVAGSFQKEIGYENTPFSSKGGWDAYAARMSVGGPLGGP